MYIWIFLKPLIPAGKPPARRWICSVRKDFFGTDGPFGFHGPDHQYDYGFIKRRIEGMFADVIIREKLLGGSFAKVVGLS